MELGYLILRGIQIFISAFIEGLLIVTSGWKVRPVLLVCGLGPLLRAANNHKWINGGRNVLSQALLD